MVLARNRRTASAAVLALACAEAPTPPPPQPVEAPPPPAPPAPAATEALRAVWATSGSAPGHAFDGDPATSWSPAGEPTGEAVAAAFETAASFTRATVSSCPGASTFVVELEVDGTRVGTAEVGPETPATVVPAGGGARGMVVALRIRGPARTVCIGDVHLDRGGAALPLALPRTVPGSVAATSSRKPFPEANPPSYAFDGRLDTPWVEGAASQGNGEVLEVAVDAPQSVTAVELWNGDGRGPDAMMARGAVRRLRLSVDGGAWTDLPFDPVPASQVVSMQVPLRGRNFRVQIDDVAGGPSVKETAISEVRFHDGAGPWTIGLDDFDRHSRVVRVDLSNAPLTSALDRNLAHACPPPGATRTLRFRSDATLAHVQREGPTDLRLDGTWAWEGARGPWNRVDVWQYSHVVADAEVARPTAPPASFATRVEFARAADLDAAGVGAFVDALEESDRACLPERFAGGSVSAELQKLDAVLIRGPHVAGVWIPVPAAP
jgi:hypothetical protein